jgi:hypothetical protein
MIKKISDDRSQAAAVAFTRMEYALELAAQIIMDQEVIHEFRNRESAEKFLRVASRSKITQVEVDELLAFYKPKIDAAVLFVAQWTSASTPDKPTHAELN